MKKVNNFIIDHSPGSHYIEWAKKEACWLAVKEHNWSYNLDEIRNDFIDEQNPPKRNRKTDAETAELEKKKQEDIVLSIPSSLWEKIGDWGRDTENLSPNRINIAFNIASKIKRNRKLLDNEISVGYAIFEKVWECNSALIEEADELAEQEQADSTRASNTTEEITIDLITKMVEWDSSRRNLASWKLKVMKEVVDGKRVLDDKLKYGFHKNLLLLRSRGFIY
jgi:hypothetical protein